jgi:hypothetical protein
LGGVNKVIQNSGEAHTDPSSARAWEMDLRAVIEAYGRGEIELETVDSDAPFKKVLRNGKTYTLGTVARFLGWVKPSDGQAIDSCRIAFDAYQKAISAAKRATMRREDTLKQNRGIDAPNGATVRSQTEAAERSEYTMTEYTWSIHARNPLQ